MRMQDRTHCAAGHPYTPANTYRSRFSKRKPSGGTRVYAGRRCRTCAKIWRSIRYHLRQKGAEGDEKFLGEIARRVEMRCEGLWV